MLAMIQSYPMNKEALDLHLPLKPIQKLFTTLKTQNTIYYKNYNFMGFFKYLS